MRARFSAYSLALCNYIISTTHPNGPHFQDDLVRWHLQLQDFASQTRFEGLELLEETKGSLQAQVAFRATLSQQGRDASFSELSLFVRHEDRWLYHSGEKLAAKAH
jgi:SEC-C motif-containing protein